MSNLSDMSRHDTTPLSARSLALSVLLGTHPPELSVRSLVALGELFGIAGGTMRTALSRLAAAGDVVVDDGRYRLIGAQLERQRSQDIGRRPPPRHWDGHWHSIVTAPDQRDITSRRTFRTTMANHRFGELRPDIWMRPANLAAPPADPSTLLVTGSLEGVDPTLLVERLWALGDIIATSEALVDELDRLRGGLDWSSPESLPAAFVASARVVRFLRREPQLPGNLTPPGWPVDEVRRRYDDFESQFQGLLSGFLRTR
jgi:phenylacetic acid degradation operon negative regulatory protein